MKDNRALVGLISFLILIACLNCKEKPMMDEEFFNFYVGTYTSGESQGIYQYAISSEGKLKKMGLKAEAENPSFLTFDKSRQYLLAVNEVSNEESVGYVSSFKIDKDSLFLINQRSSGGSHPCHITINSEGFVVVANYSGGNMGLLRLESDGELSELLDIQQHEGNGSHVRQEAPHAHSGWFSKEGNVISVDLGTNQLWFSQINRDSLKFEPAEPKTFNLEDGAGPRHLAFHPTNDWMYVVNELTSSISLVKKDLATGEYLIGQTISTLPKNFNEDNTCADIHISSDGKNLYASNRGHNSIAIFVVDETTGQLTSMGHQSTHGQTPRNFSLSPNERFLLVANQNSNNIVSFGRDYVSGLLTYLDEIEAPSPVCLLF